MKRLVCGDCLEILPMLAADSVDLICCDPPYGIGFMNLNFDTIPDFQSWCGLWAKECLRVLKPGAHAFVMAIPRMYHRLAVAFEDAGFVVNTPILWVFPSGFPKSSNIGKSFDRRAFEEWLDGIPHGLTAEEKRKVVSVAVNGEYHNPRASIKGSISGSLSSSIGVNPDRSEGARLLADLLAKFWDGEGLPPGVRVKVGIRTSPYTLTGRNESPDYGKFDLPHNERGYLQYNLSAPSTPLAQQWEGWHSPQLKPAYEVVGWFSKPLSEGTFAENVECWGTGAVNVDAARIPLGADADVEEIHEQSSPNPVYIGGAKPGDVQLTYNEQGYYPANIIASEGGALPLERMKFFNLDKWAETRGIADIPKASRSEKEAGLEGMPLIVGKGALRGNEDGSLNKRTQGKPTEGRNTHATVKSIKLMSWLLALGCPPGGLVVDPFMGTGTTLIAAELGGWQYLGIDIDPKWCDIAQRRLRHWAKYGTQAPTVQAVPGVEQGGLWDD